jgi:hypothetical protein
LRLRSILRGSGAVKAAVEVEVKVKVEVKAGVKVVKVVKVRQNEWRSLEDVVCDSGLISFLVLASGRSQG